MSKRLCNGCMEYVQPSEAKCKCGFDEGKYEAASHQLPPGYLLKERYLVGKVLGEGGFGITYVGRDTLLDMKVAIKEFYMSGYVNRYSLTSATITANVGSMGSLFEKNKNKFLTEARVLARFSNEEGIVGIRDFFETNNTAYIVMEFLEGITLKEYLSEKGKLTGEETLKIMNPILHSLKEVHGHNVIHRDISPDNIMLTQNGKVKLLDFGAAREVSEGDSKSLSVILKPGYAPEEQYRSKGKQGAWTDIYALCATMYKCITGKVPEDSMERMFEDELEEPVVLEPACNPYLSKAIMKGMSVRAKDRYQSIAELQEILAIVKDNPVSVTKASSKEVDLDRTAVADETSLLGYLVSDSIAAAGEDNQNSDTAAEIQGGLDRAEAAYPAGLSEASAEDAIVVAEEGALAEQNVSENQVVSEEQIVSENQAVSEASTASENQAITERSNVYARRVTESDYKTVYSGDDGETAYITAPLSPAEELAPELKVSENLITDAVSENVVEKEAPIPMEEYADATSVREKKPFVDQGSAAVPSNRLGRRIPIGAAILGVAILAVTGGYLISTAGSSVRDTNPTIVEETAKDVPQTAEEDALQTENSSENEDSAAEQEETNTALLDEEPQEAAENTDEAENLAEDAPDDELDGELDGKLDELGDYSQTLPTYKEAEKISDFYITYYTQVDEDGVEWDEFYVHDTVGYYVEYNFHLDTSEYYDKDWKPLGAVALDTPVEAGAEHFINLIYEDGAVVSAKIVNPSSASVLNVVDCKITGITMQKGMINDPERVVLSGPGSFYVNMAASWHEVLGELNEHYEMGYVKETDTGIYYYPFRDVSYDTDEVRNIHIEFDADGTIEYIAIADPHGVELGR